MYTELIVGAKSYKLRLTTKMSMALEKALCYNPILMLMEIDDGKIPSLSDCITVLHYMLQTFNHGLSLDDTIDIYDAFIAEGHTMFDLIPIFVEVFQESGFLAKDATEAEGEAEKN